MTRSMRARLTMTLVAAVASMPGFADFAGAETLRVGKAGREAFSFVPADIAARTGILKKRGIDIEISSFGGDARVQQAMAADGIDIGLGSGPDWRSLPRARRSRASPRWPIRRSSSRWWCATMMPSRPPTICAAARSGSRPSAR